MAAEEQIIIGKTTTDESESTKEQCHSDINHQSKSDNSSDSEVINSEKEDLQSKSINTSDKENRITDTAEVPTESTMSSTTKVDNEDNSELVVQVCKDNSDIVSQVTKPDVEHKKLKPMISIEAKKEDDDGTNKKTFITSLNLVLKKHDSKLPLIPPKEEKKEEETSCNDLINKIVEEEPSNDPELSSNSSSSLVSSKEDIIEEINETEEPQKTSEKIEDNLKCLKGNILVRKNSVFGGWDRYFSQINSSNLDCFASPEDQEINGDPKQIYNLNDITAMKKAKKGFIKPIYYLSIKRSDQPKIRLGFHERSEQERWFDAIKSYKNSELKKLEEEKELTRKLSMTEKTEAEKSNVTSKTETQDSNTEDVKTENLSKIEEPGIVKPKRSTMKDMGVSLGELQNVKLRKSISKETIKINSENPELNVKENSPEKTFGVKLKSLSDIEENSNNENVTNKQTETNGVREDEISMEEKRGSQISVIKHAESIEIVFNDPVVEFGKTSAENNKFEENSLDKRTKLSSSDLSSVCSSVEFPHVSVEIKETGSNDSTDELSEILIDDDALPVDNISVISRTPRVTPVNMTYEDTDKRISPILSKTSETEDEIDVFISPDEVSNEKKDYNHDTKIVNETNVSNDTEKDGDKKLLRRLSSASTSGEDKKGQSKIKKIFRRMTSEGNIFDRVLKRRSFRKSVDITDKYSTKNSQSKENVVSISSKKNIDEEDTFYNNLENVEFENAEKDEHIHEDKKDSLEIPKDDAITESTETLERVSEPLFNSDDNLLLKEITGQCQQTSKTSNWSINAQTSNGDIPNLVDNVRNSELDACNSTEDKVTIQINNSDVSSPNKDIVIVGSVDKTVPEKSTSNRLSEGNEENVFLRQHNSQPEMPSNLTKSDKMYPSHACSSSRSSLVLPEFTVYEEDEKHEDETENNVDATNHNFQYINEISKINNKFLENEDENDDYFPSYGSVNLRDKVELEIPETQLRTSGINDLKNYLQDNEDDVMASDYKSGVNRLGSSAAVEKLKTNIN